jgi:DNA-binding NarL/FixJ family response regulator
MKASILVVDDHPIVCQGLADLINRQADVRCCGFAADLASAERVITAHKPDLVLLDLRLGSADGLESIKSLKARFDNLRILVISQFDEGIYAERALRAGALGYVMKEQATDDLLKAIRSVLAGELYVSTRVSMSALKRVLDQKPSAQGYDLSVLTDRELHVLNAIGGGKGNKDIAADMRLSVKTIETYREHLKYKLGLANSAELAQFATNWLRGDRPN